MGRPVVYTLAEVSRLLAAKKFYITAVMTKGVTDWRETQLKPQGATNPGTKELPYIYFGKLSSVEQFNSFRKTQYPSKYYILVPEDSDEGKEIKYVTTGMGGDYVKMDSLKPETEQRVVEIGPDFEKALPPGEKKTDPAPRGGEVQSCTIM